MKSLQYWAAAAGVAALSGAAIGETPTLSLQPAADAPLPAGESWREGWKGSIELGAFGSDGNTERFSVRAGAGAKRSSEKYDTSASLVYNRSTENGDQTANKLVLGARNDWKIKDSKWRFFALGEYIYDDFQDWQHRWSLYGGVGYELIKNDRTTLIGRAGLGVTQEIGGSENKIVPEGILGLDLAHKIDDRQQITANLDFFPALDEFGPYRLVAKAAYEFIVDPATNMKLKMGLEDRYDSTPGDGFKRNDLDYFILLAWDF